MKEIVVVSGKGGTGKTSLVGSLASLLKDKVVADCDVDAANLNLLLDGRVTESYEFIGGRKASINADVCTGCGTCRDVCRYNAVSPDYTIDARACEGCGACYFLCPAAAISFSEVLCGHYFAGNTDRGDAFVFAELLPGSENSGKLVAAVRAKAREKAESRGARFVLIDGPPGIGCPVISSVTGAHLALVVTEPTMSGIHDLERVLMLARHFTIPAAVVVNKGDVNISRMEDIKVFCRKNDVDFLGFIPYEPLVTEAQRQGKTVLEFAPDCSASAATHAIFEKLQIKLEEL